MDVVDRFGLFLASQPLLALFLTIAVGYWLGVRSIKGFALGSGAVLFVGLAIGAAAPQLKLPALIGNLGLMLFLYGVGIAYGAQFLRGLTSARGAKANAAALLGVLASLGLMIAATRLWPGVELPKALGAFSGAGTSTAALQAALAVFGPSPATGYSVAYPVGVAIPILLLGLYNAWRKPTLEPPAPPSLHVEEVGVDDVAVLGRTVAAVSQTLPHGVAIAAIRRGHHNMGAAPEVELQRGDVLLLSGTDPAALKHAALRFGPAEPGRILRDRSEFDYERFFVSSPQLAGKRLSELQLPPECRARILHLRRSDVDLAPHADRVLEFGDRVGVLAPRESFPTLSRYFGDSVRATGEVSYIGMGVGVTLGLAVGAISLPLPLLGHLSLGFAGLLLVALLLGWRRRTGPLTWVMPISANLVLRNFGLTVFLAVVGISSGSTFAATIAESGWLYLALGSAIVSVLVGVTLVMATAVFRLPFDAAAGIVAGATGNPAILAFSNRIAPTDQPDIGYAMIFPSMTIVKIVLVQVVAMWGA